jgi:hypothetical protein
MTISVNALVTANGELGEISAFRDLAESISSSDGYSGLCSFFSVSSSSLISIAEGDGGDGFVDIN